MARIKRANHLAFLQQALQETLFRINAAGDTAERRTLLRKLRLLIEEADQLGAETSVEFAGKGK